MAKSCVYIPSKGRRLHKQLKDTFGYQKATEIFLRFGVNPKFINDYKGTLTLDSEGLPTMSSLLKIDVVKNYISTDQISQRLQREFPQRENTLDNYQTSLEEAFRFNKENEFRDDYTAVVKLTEKGELQTTILPKTPETIEEFNNQYSGYQLNKRLSEIFGSLGVTIGMLSQREVEAGRIGLTDFNNAVSTANGFVNLIKIANNMQGAEALTEEFAHTIIGIFRDQPLVQRSLRLLENNETAVRQILGNDYEDVVKFYGEKPEARALVAEEALGHVLRDNLRAESREEETVKNIQEGGSLFRRLINFIKNTFKRFRINEVQNAITESNQAMGKLAKDILNGTKQITQDDIINSRRDVQLNALEDRVNRNVEVLENAIKTELKRYKISSDKKASKVEGLVDELMNYASDKSKTTLGLLKYAKTALGELKGLNSALKNSDSLDLAKKFSLYRSIKSYTDSYGPFIKAMLNASASELGETDDLFNIGEGEDNIRFVLSQLNDLNQQLFSQFMVKAKAAFTEFLKPFLGDDVIIQQGERAGEKLTVEDLLERAMSDINFTDRYLDSMAESSDVLLQLFGRVVDQAKGESRLKTINEIRDIQKLREKAERMGITKFDWMFEETSDGKKTGNYISEINQGQFEQDEKELEERLKEKYGENPRGEDARKKITERNAWYAENALSTFGQHLPNPAKYRNRKYDGLTQNQKIILTEFLELKKKYDDKLPSNRTALNKAIQIRKSREQRRWENLTNASQLFNNIKGSFKASLLESEDDDQLFGEYKINKGLSNFDGTEFMSLPVLYTNRLKNPEELNTDVFSTLMSYAYMANNYEAMDGVLDQLEVGRVLVTHPEGRQYEKTRGGNKLVEKFEALGIQVVNKIRPTQNNIIAKLNDFFESQIYQRYYKDEGTFKAFGKDINKGKLVNLVLKASSLAQLGFNWLANIANVTTGVCMQNIEAHAGQFFKKTELLRADGIYAKNVTGYLADLGKRDKTSKLYLFDELFNVRQNYGTQMKHRAQKKNLLFRVFGAEFAFLGQDAGDHWLYNRTAIAMALREQVLYKGKQMSLWEALKVKDVPNSSLKKLDTDNITALDGSDFDFVLFSRKITRVNHRLFGVYNEEDMNAANRVALGRLLQQYRKWMKTQYNIRFQKGQHDVLLEDWVEGYWRTTGRILNQLVRGQYQSHNLKDWEKQNVRRALFEFIQLLAVYAIANFIEWPEDKDRSQWLKWTEYGFRRLTHELGGLAPSPILPIELSKTVTSPFPSSSVLKSTIRLAGSICDPRDWNDETQSGPYKGMSTLHKNFMRSPIPIVAQKKQIDRFLEDIDTSIDFYVRYNQ